MATLNTQLYDAYVRFLRWATDRLGDHEGIVCVVSNNSFLDGIAFDSLRKHLALDFTHIYHFDLGGNARKQGGGNVFGIMVGVGITVLVRKQIEVKPEQQEVAAIFYGKLDEQQSGNTKLAVLAKEKNIFSIDWLKLLPDAKYNWFTERLRPEFDTYLPLGSREVKLSQVESVPAIVRTYGVGVITNRDSWAYDFDRQNLLKRIERFIEEYNAEISRWIRAGRPEDIDSFVHYDNVKWSRNLKRDLRNERFTTFEAKNVRKSLYRPFTSMWLYFADMIVDERGLSGFFFPTNITETENVVICAAGRGDRKGFGCLAAKSIPGFDLAFEKTQCFPYYIYAEDGSNRRENITDWALAQFQAKYDPNVTKWDIFHYVYALLHHPQYRERYAENLKRDLPHIPLLHRAEAFQTCARIGKLLMELHLHYEQAREYPLQWVENPAVPFSYRVEKMRLSPDRAALAVNASLTLAGIPPECFAYRLGNRSALEWVIDQYSVSEDKRSGIVSDPNNLDDEEYIVRLVGRVITVSVETVRLVDELRGAVTVADWMDASGNGAA